MTGHFVPGIKTGGVVCRSSGYSLMDIWDAIILGLVQGVTEFLPVSSSGHLALARSVLGFAPQTGAAFEIALHLGTLFSILLVFRRDVWAMVKVLPFLFVPSQWKSRFAADDAFRTGIYILISMVPAGILGILLKERIEALFDRPAVVGACLILTGLLLAGLRCAPKGRKPIDARSALTMGVAQAFALLPGISRAGSTISAGLWSRCERAAVGRFAFLMAIPPIAGAALLELRGGHLQRVDAVPLGVGLFVAFASGTLALLLLLRFVRGGQLHWFSPYCIILGLIAILSS